MRGDAAAGQHPAGRKIPAGQRHSAALHWYGAAVAGRQDAAGGRARDRGAGAAAAAARGYWDGAQDAFCHRRAGRAAGRAAGRHADGLHQRGGGLQARRGRRRTATTNTTWCRLANSSRRCSVVHRHDEHPAGRLQPGRLGQPSSNGRASAWRPTFATKTCLAKSWARALATRPRRRQ